VRTTGGKTKHERRPARPVEILNADGKVVAVRRASSLKQALLWHFKFNLKPRGCLNPLATGNTLMYSDQNGVAVTLIARDVAGMDTRGCS
jgi:hypothetical protein